MQDRVAQSACISRCPDRCGDGGAGARRAALAASSVTPSTVRLLKDGHPITFALHGFLEFKSLNEMFSYIDSQNQRWKSHMQESMRNSARLPCEICCAEELKAALLDGRRGPAGDAVVTHTREDLLEQRWQLLKNRFPLDMPRRSLRYRKSGSTH